jgi:hypothetical protein
MKELSIEEKAKRYDEVRKKIAIRFGSNVADEIFSQFEMSEDERIRKEIKQFIRSRGMHLAQSKVESWVAWLEKKPDTNCLLSWSETDEKMLQSLEGIVKDYWAKAEQEKNEIKIREASNVSYFLKTIQKSPLCWIKCSDGLPNRDGIYLVVTDGRHNDVYDMARYDSIEGWHKASEIIYWMPIPQLNNKSIIEQKPAWSEDDERLCQCIIEDQEEALDKVSNDKYGHSEIISDLKDFIKNS